jgi:hypothetical protein
MSGATTIFLLKERKKDLWVRGSFIFFQKNKQLSYDHAFGRERNIHA